MVSWELPEEHMDDGRPFTVSKQYTYSAAKNASLRKDLENWRGKPLTDDEAADFDLEKLIGAPAILTIVEEERDGNKYSNVATMSRLMKGQQFPNTTHNEKQVLILQPGMFSKAIYDSLSDRIKEKIAASPEYQAIASGKPMPQHSSSHQAEPDFDDEIPF